MANKAELKERLNVIKSTVEDLNKEFKELKRGIECLGEDLVDEIKFIIEETTIFKSESVNKQTSIRKRKSTDKNKRENDNKNNKKQKTNMTYDKMLRKAMIHWLDAKGSTTKATKLVGGNSSTWGNQAKLQIFKGMRDVFKGFEFQEQNVDELIEDLEVKCKVKQLC
jgi:hypothetical protein